VCGVISKIKQAWIVVYYSKTLFSARTKPVYFWLSEKPTSESHLPKLISRAGQSDISGPEKVVAQPNGVL